MEALSSLLAFAWLFVTISFVLTFIAPIRRAIARGILARYQIPLRRARWALGLSSIAAFVGIGIISAPPEKPAAPSASASSAAPVSLTTPARAAASAPVTVHASVAPSPVVLVTPHPVVTPAAPEKSGEDIIAEAPPNSRQEEHSGLRAFCSAVRDAPASGPSGRNDMRATMMLLRADEMVEHDLGISLERANIVVTRVARAFGQSIYGPADCEEALKE